MNLKDKSSHTKEVQGSETGKPLMHAAFSPSSPPQEEREQMLQPANEGNGGWKQHKVFFKLCILVWTLSTSFPVCYINAFMLVLLLMHYCMFYFQTRTN